MVVFRCALGDFPVDPALSCGLFSNPFLSIARELLFSCLNKAAAFITGANIAACASSFPFVMV